APRVSRSRSDLLDLLETIVPGDLVEELVNWHLASPCGLPEVARAKSEAGPQSAAQMFFGSEPTRPEDERDVLKLVFALRRARPAPQLPPTHLPQDRGTPALQERGDLIRRELLPLFSDCLLSLNGQPVARDGA